jgi:superfamily I DNA/RNA helicase
MIEEIKRDDSEDYLYVLKALNEIPFVVGKNLLIDFLKGRLKNKSITKNNLFTFHNFGVLSKKPEQEIRNMIDNLISNKLVDSSNLPDSFLRVLAITSKGSQELLNPSLNDKKTKNRFNLNFAEVTEQEKETFNQLGNILSKYNNRQKKAIISQKNKILCIAGAGSGKTSVLVKRIEFLVRYKSVPPEKILAITFTRKAKQEMESRLLDLGIKTNVETFNSFSEQILRKNSIKIYQRNVRVMNYQDKIFALSMALAKSGLDLKSAVDIYFSENQKRGKEPEKLSNIFLNDCYSILEYFKATKQEFYDFSKKIEKDKENAKIIYGICQDIMKHMELQGLRDFTDQLLDCLRFFKESPSEIPQFEHILVDEYQDVNDAQIELLDLLSPKNLFCVGDPRQSIFGWRGSNLDYLLKFQERFPDAEIIGLNKNYRSAKKIVEFMNTSISDLGLEDLEGNLSEEGEIHFFDFETEQEEYNFIIKRIQELNIERNEVFVLSRTNRQLTELSQKFRLLKIPHVVKSDEIKKPVDAKEGEVTLSTIHAIKGLEAKAVFVMGCNEQNFPCKASDHPILEFIKGQDSDKEEEERRLFYVAVSRAKEKLFLSYSGKKPTYFINDEMKRIIDEGKFKKIFS